MITLIDFSADWCGPCLAMKPALEKVEKEYAGKMEFQEINVDQDQQKAAQFMVMSIPTLVILKDGKEIDRRLGLTSEAVLKQWINSHLS